MFYTASVKSQFVLSFFEQVPGKSTASFKILFLYRSFYLIQYLVNHLIICFELQNVKKRLENPHFESNGSTGILLLILNFILHEVDYYLYDLLNCCLLKMCSGLYIQHAAKKPKLLKQLPDASSDAITPMTGSMTSPVASQMSNMSNSNKLIKIIANRDRGGRKHKATKVSLFRICWLFPLALLVLNKLIEFNYFCLLLRLTRYSNFNLAWLDWLGDSYDNPYAILSDLVLLLSISHHINLLFVWVTVLYFL